MTSTLANKAPVLPGWPKYIDSFSSNNDLSPRLYHHLHSTIYYGQQQSAAAVTDLTESACLARNEVMPDDTAWCMRASVLLQEGPAWQIPAEYDLPHLKHFDGLSKGLVSVESAKWGKRFTLLEPEGKRGISHGDVVDLNRENIRGFDAREFYVKLAADLKRQGY